MIIRAIERCPTCGETFPWRKYASKIVRGERVNYVTCKLCGRHEMVVYRDLLPESGKSSEKID